MFFGTVMVVVVVVVVVMMISLTVHCMSRTCDPLTMQ